MGDYAYARVKTHNHNFNGMWKSDSANHWIECTCGSKADFAVHIPGTAATETDPQVCTVCQYVITPATGHKDEDKDYKCDVCGTAVGTKPTAPEKPTDLDNPQTGDNSNMAPWITLIVVSGAGVLGIVVYSRRKKEQME